MRRLLAFILALTLVALAATAAHAGTYKLTDGSTLEGEFVSATEKGVLVRLPDGSYSERVAWDKFAEEELKKLLKDPKYGRYVQGLVVEEETEAAKKPVKPPVVVKPVEIRLDRPSNPALIGGFFGSPVGWLIVLTLFGANLWAAYEVAAFRAQPVALVCGISAVVPLITQIVFLAMPTRMPKQPTAEEEAAAVPQEVAEAEEKLDSALRIAHESAESEKPTGPAPPTIFKRGEFAFNRRFFETKFSNFFGMVRRDKDKSAILVIKTGRAEYTANRITRITANDMHIEVAKGGGVEEVAVSFPEVQEVQLRHGR